MRVPELKTSSSRMVKSGELIEPGFVVGKVISMDLPEMPELQNSLFSVMMQTWYLTLGVPSSMRMT
jgi:hypothetical protein